MTVSVELSVVMAAFNEGRSIESAVQDVADHVAPCVGSMELIVVDDGSTDGTGRLLDKIAARCQWLQVLHRPNGGHGPALIEGIRASRGHSILLLDADRQIALDDFPAHWEAFRTNDAVLGIRLPRRDGRVRACISWAMRGFGLMLFGKAPRDGGTPFKLIRAQVWREVAPLISPTNVLPSVILAIYVIVSGQNVVQRPVKHRARRGSMSSLNLPRLLTLCVNAAIALVRFRIALRRPTTSAVRLERRLEPDWTRPTPAVSSNPEFPRVSQD
jgi:glycosyltransferase involved in cell wall biosynthesis